MIDNPDAPTTAVVEPIAITSKDISIPSADRSRDLGRRFSLISQSLRKTVKDVQQQLSLRFRQDLQLQEGASNNLTEFDDAVAEAATITVATAEALQEENRPAAITSAPYADTTTDYVQKEKWP